MFRGAPEHAWVEPEARDRAWGPPACQESWAPGAGGVEMGPFDGQLSMKRYVKFYL